ATGHPKLGKYMREVVFDSLRADVKVSPNLFICHPLCYQGEDLQLLPAQLSQFLRLPLLVAEEGVKHSSGQMWVYPDPSRLDGSDSAQESSNRRPFQNVPVGSAHGGLPRNFLLFIAARHQDTGRQALARYLLTESGKATDTGHLVV